MISVVIPAWREGTRLGDLARSLNAARGVEVIAAVPEEDHATAAHAAEGGALVVRCERGRGAQLVAGARRARGEILLFCHADTRLPAEWANEVRTALDLPGVAGGAFRLKIDAAGLGYRIIERMANLRARVACLPYGDQALFITRGMYDAIGGFAPLPLMEDVDFVRRLRRRGRLALLNEEAATSARRWEREGVLFGTMRNWTLLTLYLLGVSPVSLAAWYRR